MRKNILLLLAAVLFSMNAFSQNLVPNPGFEAHSACPTDQNQVPLATPWMNPLSGSISSPDYYNKCGVSYMGVPNNLQGYQPAHGGDAYVGFYTWQKNIIVSQTSHEYVETPLKEALAEGRTYTVSMYVNLVDICRYTSKTIEAYFSKDSISGFNNYSFLPLTPQFSNKGTKRFDTSGWTLVSGDFTAKGGERYMTIGNFNYDTNTDTARYQKETYDFVYVFLDDVSVVPKGTTTGIGNIANNPVSAIPNPLTEQVSIKVATTDNYEMRMIDVNGRLIYQKSFNASFDLNTGSFPSGMYYYELRCKGDVIDRQKLIKL